MFREVSGRFREAVAVVGLVERLVRNSPATCRKQLPGLRQVLLKSSLPGQDTQKIKVSIPSD